MRLRYVIGAVADFNAIGIDVSECRKSINPLNVNAIIHQELLNDAQFDAVISSGLFTFMSSDNPDLIAMLNSPEWASAEEI